MNIKIEQKSCKFVQGLFNQEHLHTWTQNNPEAKGICFCGRSNVGKSSLLNSLFGKSQAKTSNTPGRTREINIFTFNLFDKETPDDLHEFFLFDLPGYGHARVSKAQSEIWNYLMAGFFKFINKKYIFIVGIQDARHPNQKADIDFLNFIKTQENNKFFVFNKIDKLKTQKERTSFSKEHDKFKKSAIGTHSTHQTSAIKRDGIDQLRDELFTEIYKLR